MTDPLDFPKYRNAAHCAYVMIKEEGAGSLYKGVGLTALRQSTNQAANFTVYQFMKQKLHEYQPKLTSLPWYQLMVSGFISGACGPLFNAPIDTIKVMHHPTFTLNNNKLRRVFKRHQVLKRDTPDSRMLPRVYM